MPVTEAEIEAAAEAIRKVKFPEASMKYPWETVADKQHWRDEAKAALAAAERVRRQGTQGEG